MTPPKVSLDVETNAEYFDSRPDRAVVELTPQLVRHILHLSAVVRKLKVYKIEEFDYRPEFIQTDGDDKEVSEDKLDWHVDTCLLCVKDDGCNWSLYLKNDNDELFTNHLWLKELRELNSVWRAPRNRLPLLLGSLEYKPAIELLEQRMSERSKS